MTASTFHAVCHLPHFAVPLVWDGETRNTMFGDYFHHFRTEHHRRAYTVRPPLDAKMWHTPRRKEFIVQEFSVGAFITWVDSTGQHTGQVWALAHNDTCWVADGTEFHRVHRAQLVRANRKDRVS